MRLVAVAVALVACMHAGIWALSEKRIAAPDIHGPLASVSYGKHPDKQVGIDEIQSDLRMLAPHTRAVRTYSSTNGLEMVPSLAAQAGLRVTAGAWLGGSLDDAEWQGKGPDASNGKRYRERLAERARNTAELNAVVEIARKNSNVEVLRVQNFWIDGFPGNVALVSVVNVVNAVVVVAIVDIVVVLIHSSPPRNIAKIRRPKL